ncbi:[histone H3]-trimethyl-L-lysine(9) demethylase [Aphelenchoides fujianensis]|nr:[histone H3]-trimethyl-L-lysine(9) demethylase [Aphelenchoides fujianensis]
MGEYRPTYTKQEEWVNTGTRSVRVFHPTLEEMGDFSAYIQKCEDEGGAHLSSGICKIVPPKGWSPRPSKGSDYSDMDDYMIQSPVRETIMNGAYAGSYTKSNKTYRKELSVREFRSLAISKFSSPHPEQSLKELERYFWRNITTGIPIYGADSPGSCYEDSVEEFNLTKLRTCLDLLKEEGVQIPGVTNTYLYFGSYKTVFPWHCEDVDLYSINYLHFGEPKFWFSIPPSQAEKFERLCAQKFPEEAAQCKAYLRHKLFIVTTRELRNHGIDYGTMVQWPGEFMITFPKGYHMGFNTGYNCAESTNFALERWVDIAMHHATFCKCTKGAVELDLRLFVKKLRPELYDTWHDFYYKERIVVKKTPALPPAALGDKQMVEVEARDPVFIDRAVFDSFMDNLEQSRVDFSFLFQDSHDFKEEHRYNLTSASIFPFCSICQKFVPSSEAEGKFTRDAESPRYAIDAFFDKQPTDFDVLPLQNSPLLRCKKCAVVVHAACYNVNPDLFDFNSSNDSEELHTDEPSPEKKKAEAWLCRRCSISRRRDRHGQHQVPLLPAAWRGPHPVRRGGQDRVRARGLRDHEPTDADPSRPNWAHEETNAEHPAWDAIGLDYEYLTHDPDLFARRPLGDSANRCAFCRIDLEDTFVRCVNCFDNDEVPLYFHPSCCSFAGLTIEYRSWPVLAVVACQCHVEVDRKKDQFPIFDGDVLGFKSPDFVGVVRLLETRSTEFLTMDFFDGTTSTDVEKQDVVDCECRHVGCEGQHKSGWLLYVVDSKESPNRMVCSRLPLFHRGEPKPKDLEKKMNEAALL